MSGTTSDKQSKWSGQWGEIPETLPTLLESGTNEQSAYYDVVHPNGITVRYFRSGWDARQEIAALKLQVENIERYASNADRVVKEERTKNLRLGCEIKELREANHRLCTTITDDDKREVLCKEHVIVLQAAVDKALAANARLKNQGGAELQQLREQVAVQAATIDGQIRDLTANVRTIGRQDKCINAKADEISMLGRKVELANRAVMAHAQELTFRDARIKHLEGRPMMHGCPVEVVGRTPRDITQDPRDTTLAANASRIRWLEDKVAGLEMQWAMRPKPASHNFGVCCQPTPGSVYLSTPKMVTVDALFVGDIPATCEYRNPKSVTLTF